MSFFGIKNRNKRQFGRGFICRVFVALFLLAFSGALAALISIKVHAGVDPVHSIEFASEHNSYEDEVPGSWTITKTAGWTGHGDARIIFNIDTLAKLEDKGSDILLVVNRSSEDDEDMFDDVTAALESLVNKFMDDGDNRVALVTFGHSYTIETDFTDNRSLLLGKVSNINKTTGQANYYQGLNGAERVLRNYTYSEDRNIIIVFLTNNQATEEVLYQSAEYRLMKAIYPYAVINAIQYRFGDEITGSLKAISDNQFIADHNTIGDVIFEASVVPYDYDEFILTDYINDDYFMIDGINDISASQGDVSLSYENGTPKVAWDLGEAFRSGSSAEMKIDIKLKPEYVTTPGTYETNKLTTVTTALPETASENITIDSTPILKTDYKVIYVANKPSSCTVNGVPAEEVHYVYETIPYSNAIPTCEGYEFKGWKIAEEHIAKINNDYFVMPDKDIHILAIWAKPSITKTMDGTVRVIQTLYNAIARKSLALGSDNQFNLDDGLDFTRPPSATNSIGVKTVTATADDEYPVHYFRGDVSDNHVLFAGICWKAVRTTSTGGVKLIYNGEADEGHCGSSRGNHDGYGTTTTKNMASNYYYGTDFIYDEASDKFTLSGVKTLAKWSDETSESLINKYTCVSTDPNAECSTLYFIYSRSTNESAYVMPLKANIPYYSIGSTQYNVNDESPAYAGYMFGYSQKTDTISLMTYTESATASLFPYTSLSTAFWYADSISYGNDVADQYSLINPYKVSSSSDYSSLVGKYTFRNSSEDYHNDVVYYIVSVSSSTMYYIQLEDGQLLPGIEESYVFGNDFTDNGDGTYTLIDTFEIKKRDWGTRYNEVAGKFTCGDIGGETCGSPRYINSATGHSYTFVRANISMKIAKSHNGLELQDYITVRLFEVLRNPSDYSEYRYTCRNLDSVCTSTNFSYIYGYNNSGRITYNLNIVLGSGVSWNGSQYELTGVIDISENNPEIATHHFACLTMGQTTCEKAIYFYGYYSSSSFGSANYEILEGGMTTPAEILTRMFENTHNSTLKSIIDAWYARTLTDYTYMIEDTPYCNDRSYGSNNGWDPNTPLSRHTLWFGIHSSTTKPSTNCTNNHDAFTVSPENGNGDLTYPVGLLTEDEVVMAGQGYSYSSSVFDNSTSFLEGGATTWTMTPANYDSNNLNVYFWKKGSDYRYLSINSFQTRPVISIKPGVYIDSGSGTENDPWTLAE